MEVNKEMGADCPQCKSILETVRQMIGPSVSYDVFDTDLIININAAFSRLCQLGVGPASPFKISGTDETWSDFTASSYQEEVKQYIYLKTKVIFDPPASATVLDAYNKQIDMLEWTLKEVARFGY
jgi:hypothetical protein